MYPISINFSGNGKAFGSFLNQRVSVEYPVTCYNSLSVLPDRHSTLVEEGRSGL